jgi:hypothetical protein
MDAPDPPTPPEVPSGLPSQRTDGDQVAPSTPTAPDWRSSYEGARAKLLAGDFASAAILFAELERTASNDVDRATARAQQMLADDWTARGIAFTRRQDLAAPEPVKLVDKRTTDEIVSLYLNSVLYGAGSGLWVATLTHPDSFAAAVLPVLVLTGGSVGTVMALDRGRGLRHGVAQSIVTGTYIGLEHGIAWTFFHNNKSGTPDLQPEVHASIIWGLATAGAVGGGLLGSVIPTTPGRSAWVGSTTLWTGALFGLAAAAVDKDHNGTPLAIAGGGLTAGMPIGILTAGSISPSISRVRLLDVSGVVGGLIAAAVYAAAVKNNNSNGVAGSMGIGTGVGLIAGFAATSSMGKDQLRTPADASSDDSKSDSAQATVDKSFLARVHPLMTPSQYGGAIIGAGGSLD